MEKFTTWRDPATGIHPFLPVTMAREWTLGSIIYRLVGLALGSVRIVIVSGLLLTWMALLLVVTLLSKLFLSPRLAYSLLRAVDSTMGHAVLLVLGFFHISLRRMSFRSGAGDEIALTLARREDGDRIHAQDLVLVNSQSPLDILILCTKFSPTFTAVDPASKQVRACSRWFALLNCTQPGAVEPGHDASSLLHVVSTAHSPVVVFPEGTTGNGRALLPMVADLTGLVPNQRIHLWALKYAISDGGFLPTLTLPGIRNWLAFFRSLSNQWFNTVSIKWIDARTLYSSPHLPPPADGKLFSTQLSAIFQALLHTRTVTLSLQDKANFLKAYLG